MAKNKNKGMLKQQDKSQNLEQELESKQDLAPEQELVDFDSWWAVRKGSVPKQHRKEILVADFRARGLKADASMEDFDKALVAYGVRL